jgi:chemotaxis protein CheZ
MPQPEGLDAIAREIEAVAGYIRGLRHAINALRAPDIVENRISPARTDLKDVVGVTREAANQILDTAEALVGAAETGDAYRAMVEERMFGLMELCSFQDLTGQRIDRVSRTLDALDERLARFAATVKAINGEADAATQEAALERWRIERLVHGPGGELANRQDRIDELLQGA